MIKSNDTLTADGMNCYCKLNADYSVLLTVSSLGFLLLVCALTFLLSYNRIKRNIDSYNFCKIRGVYFLKAPEGYDIDHLQKEHNSKFKVYNFFNQTYFNFLSF